MAAKLFNQLGDRYEYMAWVMHNDKAEEEKVFKKCRRWAKFDNVPYPFADKFPDLELPFQTTVTPQNASRILIVSAVLLFAIFGVIMIAAVLIMTTRHRKRSRCDRTEPPAIPPSKDNNPPDS